MSDTTPTGSNGMDSEAHARRHLNVMASLNDTDLNPKTTTNPLTKFKQMIQARSKNKLKIIDDKDSDVAGAYKFADYAVRDFENHGISLGTSPQEAQATAARWYLGLDLPRTDQQFAGLLETLKLWEPHITDWKLNAKGEPVTVKKERPLKDADIEKISATQQPLIRSINNLIAVRAPVVDLLNTYPDHQLCDQPLPPKPVIRTQPVRHGGNGHGNGSSNGHAVRSPLYGNGHGGGNVIADYKDGKYITGRWHNPKEDGDYADLPSFTLREIQNNTKNFHEFVRVSRLLSLDDSIETIKSEDNINISGWEIGGNFPHFKNLIHGRDVLFKRDSAMADKLMELFVRGKYENAVGALHDQIDHPHRVFSQLMNDMPREYWVDVLRKAKAPQAWADMDKDQRPIWYDCVFEPKSRCEYAKAVRFALPDPAEPTPPQGQNERFTPCRSIDDFITIVEDTARQLHRAKRDFVSEKGLSDLESQRHIDDKSEPFRELKSFCKSFCTRYPKSDFASAYDEKTFNRMSKAPVDRHAQDNAVADTDRHAGNGTSNWTDRAVKSNGAGHGTNGTGEPNASHASDIAASRATTGKGNDRAGG